MIIGVSGKIGSGKDTVGKIIQYLCWDKDNTESLDKFNQVYTEIDKFTYQNLAAKQLSGWEIKKFADKLKDIVCILIGCTREQLEDHKFKNTPLGEKWTRYAYAIGHKDVYLNGEFSKGMISKFCSKEKYEEERRINWQTAYKSELTPRLLLQLIGTECGREIIHPDIWVNALMNEYKNSISITHKLAGEDNISDDYEPEQSDFKNKYPNWIITDVRFPNEANAIIQKGYGLGIFFKSSIVVIKDSIPFNKDCI